MITATCGHEIKNMGRPVAIMAVYQDNIHAIHWNVLCPKCLRAYKKKGLILETWRDQEEWLHDRKIIDEWDL